MDGEDRTEERGCSRWGDEFTEKSVFVIVDVLLVSVVKGNGHDSRVLRVYTYLERNNCEGLRAFVVRAC